MSEESLVHAAKRVIRFVRINDTHDGGLLTRETLEAVGRLSLAVEHAEKSSSAQSSA